MFGERGEKGDRKKGEGREKERERKRGRTYRKERWGREDMVGGRGVRREREGEEDRKERERERERERESRRRRRKRTVHGTGETTDTAKVKDKNHR